MIFVADELPNHICDENIILSISESNNNVSEAHYQVTLGLLLKIRNGIKRLVKRCKLKRPFDGEILMKSVNYFAADASTLSLWSTDMLFHASHEISKKMVNLSSDLLKRLDFHPLYPPVNHDGGLFFEEMFLNDVAEYHLSVARPAGTFETKEDTMPPNIQALKSLDRETCVICGGRRQIYCGPCGGLRLANATTLLPPRIELPFDVLILLHWQETLVKCTGIHAAVLATEGSVSYMHWCKDGHGEMSWEDIVAGLDASKDAVLFPSDDAEMAHEFSWHENGRVRLVVLEASWQHGKNMARLIRQHRKSLGLQPLQYVKLESIVGGYWKFHVEGHSAVSTIEAIAHTAVAAGLPAQDMDTVLTLFHVQKHRVLENMSTGNKPPRAIVVAGAGIGAWSRSKPLLPPTPPIVEDDL